MTSARHVLDGAVREKDFREQVRQLAELQGWECYFTWTSVHSPGGFPDLVLCRPPRLVFAELKSMSGTVSALQDYWLRHLRAVPSVETYCWRPSDWQEITRVLGGRLEVSM